METGHNETARVYQLLIHDFTSIYKQPIGEFAYRVSIPQYPDVRYRLPKRNTQIYFHGPFVLPDLFSNVAHPLERKILSRLRKAFPGFETHYVGQAGKEIKIPFHIVQAKKARAIQTEPEPLSGVELRRVLGQFPSMMRAKTQGKRNRKKAVTKRPSSHRHR